MLRESTIDGPTQPLPHGAAPSTLRRRLFCEMAADLVGPSSTAPSSDPPSSFSDSNTKGSRLRSTCLLRRLRLPSLCFSFVADFVQPPWSSLSLPQPPSILSSSGRSIPSASVWPPKEPISKGPAPLVARLYFVVPLVTHPLMLRRLLASTVSAPFLHLDLCASQSSASSSSLRAPAAAVCLFMVTGLCLNF
ncbi:hypothetical protein PIB30_073295 [Stylosanthes scabra]|uniref:Uncharacterized protein n=1 Tax=Stylosanthes scabra TaxID=79078 RepID=A0ABU6UN47_9FABA|nr:hypothetical protein [Stylosanthes scabra]